MAGFMAIPKQQFFDDSGNVLVGGKFYTYDVSSTTPKASYPTIADAIAGTNAHTNPVVLDGAGRASIVLAGPTKCILKNSLGEAAAGDTPAGTTIWTVDNVSSDNTVLDANGEPVLGYVTVSSAVNYVTVAGGATGNAAVIDTAGSDATPNLKVQADGGTGTVTVVGLAATSATLNSPTIDSATITNTTLAPTTPLTVAGNASNGAQLRLAENTGNGTNYVGWQSPASVATNKLWILPSADGAANTAMVTDGSATLAFSTLTLVAASQAQQETATSTVVPVVPAVQQYHPSSAKAWLLCDVSGTINNSYNITSITDTGAGAVTVTIATDFSSTAYTPFSAVNSTGALVTRCLITGAGACNIAAFTSTTGVAADPSSNHQFIAFGDQ